MILDYCTVHDALLDKDFEDQVRELIKGLGYEIKKEDEALLGFMVADAVQDVLDRTNQSFLPAGLKTYLVKMVVGRFFIQKVRTVGMDADFNFQKAVVSIEEGGDRVAFDESTGVEDKFMAYMDQYAGGGDSRWVHYRRLTW